MLSEIVADRKHGTPIITNWCVLSGAPCSGKTTLIQRLSDQGHPVVPEVARDYIDAQLASGLTLQQIKADALRFERHILLEKVRLERTLAPDRQIFLDRAVPDSVAYFRLEGLDPAEPLDLSREFRYRKIFMLDRLPFSPDRIRSEDDRTADRLQALLIDTYFRLNYPIIRVPVLEVDKRLEFILDHLADSPPRSP